MALAIDRQSLVKSVHGGVGIAGGGTMLPPPWGVWGIPPERMSAIPGMGGVMEQEREKARRIMRDLGYGPDKPLKVNVSTRALAIYVKTAIWLIDQLKDVWIDAKLNEVETGQWYGKMARRDFELALNLTGVGVDDPDADLVENYACTSMRNYSGYCNPDVDRKIRLQSAETDFKKRLELVHEIDINMQVEGARPILVHRLTYTGFWPYLKNVVMHQSQYSSWRLQEVWLDK
jgi:peptide/nickel transport system substrate-binding protein